MKTKVSEGNDFFWEGGGDFSFKLTDFTWMGYHDEGGYNKMDTYK